MLLSDSISISLQTSLILKTKHRKNAVVLAQQQLKVLPASTNLTISDEALTSRGFNICHTSSDLNHDHLFVAVGFPKRDTDKIPVALDNTDALLWIEHEKTRRPVAFARATGNGVFNVMICDVVMDPSFQGIGLGKAVMERLVNELLAKLRRGLLISPSIGNPGCWGFIGLCVFAADPDGSVGWVR